MLPVWRAERERESDSWEAGHNCHTGGPEQDKETRTISAAMLNPPGDFLCWSIEHCSLNSFIRFFLSSSCVGSLSSVSLKDEF